jgi:N-glycosylase/DNA lyase
MQNLTVSKTDHGISVSGITDFDPEHIFDCGQCFRWKRQPDGSFTGVASGRIANVRMQNGIVYLSGVSEDDFRDFWYGYFDLARDYGAIKKELAAKDPVMKAAVEFGGGMRLLKQDRWETLLSFILSSSSRIPRIKQCVEVLAAEFGEKLPASVCGEGFHAFPDIERLRHTDEAAINICRGGYRCAYIDKTVKAVLAGDVDLDSVETLDTAHARAELMRLPGVGRKVADCVLLFSGMKSNVFPSDVWVQNVMREVYFKKPAEIQTFAAEYFGDNRGIAQEYLFYYARYHMKFDKKAGRKAVKNA